NQDRRKNPPIWQGGVNEDMAIVSFVCFMCCSLQRQKFAVVRHERQQKNPPPGTGGGQGQRGSKWLNNFRSFDIPIVATATG
ncbi:hypothetical protein, partial [Escherichia coli]|uniref:hypothetical protein n=1 Tax=Escherichia coli TaxID=562 RepID=UPI001A8EC359